jgi:hypothetical protein
MFYSVRKLAFAILSFMAMLTLVSLFLDEPTATHIQVSSYVAAFWLLLLIAAVKVFEVFAKPVNHHKPKGE